MSDVWAPPRAEVKDVSLTGNPDAIEIRQAHLNHEASIKAIGILYYIGAAAMLLAGIGLLISAVAGDSSTEVGEAIGAGVACLAIFALYFWVGRGLRALKHSTRVAAGVLAGIGLLGFPFGTMINGYILYLLFSRKGTMVFSEEYKQIIADTPDIKYRTSIIVWIFVALLVAMGVAVLLIVATGH